MPALRRREARMTSSAGLAAIALLLTDSSVANAAGPDQAGNAVFSGTIAMANNAGALPLTSRASRPAYGKGGWRCPPGFVWRNAGPKDWLCVDGLEARRIAQENQQASANAADASDGRPACRAGLVRREAFKSDIVCVEPLRREVIRTMNLALYTDL
jgi:hypothetical protein